MNVFAREALEKLADWQPIAEGFDLLGSIPHEDSLWWSTTRVALWRAIEVIPECTAEVTDDGRSGLSTYFSFFCGESAAVQAGSGDPPDGRSIHPGLMAYLSLLAPVAVVGRGSIHRTTGHAGPASFATRKLPRFSSFSSDPIRLDSMLDPFDVSITRCEASVIAAIRAAGYTVLSREEAGQRLPADIQPYECCFDDPPWDRVFHLLFANTD